MASDATLSEKIYQELYQDITQRRIPCGQSLTLQVLKDRFGVSHTPIREALTRLAGDGLVSYSANKGVKVVEFTETEIREIFQFIAELEVVAMNLCRNTFSLAPLLSDLETIIREEAAALAENDLGRYNAVAGKFHDLFYRYANNRYLAEVTNRVAAKMELMSNYYATEDRYTEIHDRQKAIYQAIREDDFTRAAEEIRAHLQFSMIYTLKGYQEDQEQKGR